MTWEDLECVSTLKFMKGLRISHLHCGLYDAGTHDTFEGTSLPYPQSYHLHGFPGLKEKNGQLGQWKSRFVKLYQLIYIAAASLLKHTSTVLSVVRVTLNPVCTRFPEWGATKQETPINAKNNSYRCLLLQYHSNTFPIVSVSSPVRVAVQWLTAAGHWVFCTAPRIQHLQIQVNYKLIGLRWQTKWLGDIM